MGRELREYGNKFKIQNSKFKILNFAFLFYILIFAFCLSCFAQGVKEPNVAGAFYPDDPEELSRMIDGFLKAATPTPQPGEIFALILPHAGYGFSGSTAAFGYKLLKDRKYKTVVVIGPSHQYGFTGVSVYPQGVFRTPLGDIEVDQDFAAKLLGKDEAIKFLPLAFAKEHSIEVQLPFLQKSLPKHSGWKIVPLVMGDCDLDACNKLASLLEEAIGKRQDVLVVVSSDMYHGYDYAEAEKIDQETLSVLKEMDAASLYAGIEKGSLQLCGEFPVVTALILAKALGHQKLEVLQYTTSANVTGRKTKGVWTVGYASCVIDQAPLEPIGRQKKEMRSLTGQEKGEKRMLNQTQRKKLLEIARQSIENYLLTKKKIAVSEKDPLLNQELGAFVTLRESGDLRGCIGNLVGAGPLYLTIRDMAIEAAVGDPRFAPLQLSELKDVEIEISVLSMMERVDSADKIQLGKHGVLVKRGFQSGVFLPQVATETGWSKEEFLAHLCADKAGLTPDAWKDKSTDIYIFTAEVFSEKSY